MRSFANRFAKDTRKKRFEASPREASEQQNLRVTVTLDIEE